MQVWDLFGSVRLEGDSQVNGAIDKISNKFKSVGNSITNFGKTLTLGVSVPLLAVGTKMVMLASDLEEVKNVVNVTFGSTAKSVIDWSANLKKSFGMVQLESLKYVGSMGAMLTSSGLSAKASEDMSKKLVELTGDMSSFYNLNHEEMWEKIRSGISGETEPLKQLGINMSVANLEAYALSQGINKAWKEMSQSEQVTLRYNYLMEQTKLAQGDFSRTSGGLANQLRILQGTFDEVGAKLGTVLLPQVLIIITKLGEWAEKISKMDEGNQKLLLFIGGLGIVIPPLLITLGLFVTAIGSLLSPAGLVIGALGLLAGGFVANQIETKGLEGFIQSLMTKLNEFKTFVIETVVPALKYLATGEGLEKVQNSSIITKEKIEELRAKFVEIKDKVMDFWDWLMKVKKIMGEELPPVIKELKGLWDELKRSAELCADGIDLVANNSGSAKRNINALAEALAEIIKAFKTIVSWGNSVVDTIAKASAAAYNFGAGIGKKINNVIGEPKANSWQELLGFAGGTDYAPGGLSIVGEKGPELVDLPRGSRVYTANETRSMLTNNNNSNITNVYNTFTVSMDNFKDLMTWNDFTNKLNIESISRGGL